MDEPRDIVYSKNVLEMITVSNELCLFVEEIEKYELVYCLSYLQKVLPLLYLKGSMLPDVEVSDETANERFVTEEQWENVFNEARKVFGKYDTFNFLKYDFQQGNQIEKGSIGEFIADIYQDIKDFLLLYQKNTLAARENAVYECKNMLAHNWGAKLLLVHKAMHDVKYGSGSGNLFSGFSPN